MHQAATRIAGTSAAVRADTSTVMLTFASDTNSNHPLWVQVWGQPALQLVHLAMSCALKPLIIARGRDHPMSVLLARWIETIRAQQSDEEISQGSAIVRLVEEVVSEFRQSGWYHLDCEKQLLTANVNSAHGRRCASKKCAR